MNDPKPPWEDDKCLNDGNGGRKHLELSWKVGHTQEDGEKEQQLEDAEHNEPGEEEEPDPTSHTN